MIFDYSKLRGRIKEKYYTQDNFAKMMGMGRVSLSQRLNNILEFTQKEIFMACELLDIPLIDIPEYFFCPKSSETRTNTTDNLQKRYRN